MNFMMWAYCNHRFEYDDAVESDKPITTLAYGETLEDFQSLVDMLQDYHQECTHMKIVGGY